MTKILCNLCIDEIIPNGNDTLLVGKLIEPVSDLKQGMRKIRETEVHLCSKCAKKILKDIIYAKPNISKKA